MQVFFEKISEKTLNYDSKSVDDEQIINVITLKTAAQIARENGNNEFADELERLTKN